MQSTKSIELDITKELEIRTSRSGGKGGQNVNKVETQVELRFNVNNSSILTSEQKAIISEKLANLINQEGELLTKNNTARTQLENKALAIKKIHKLIQHALKPSKKRLKTKIPKSVNENRIKGKKHLSELKKLRSKPVF